MPSHISSHITHEMQCLGFPGVILRAGKQIDRLFTHLKGLVDFRSLTKLFGLFQEFVGLANQAILAAYLLLSSRHFTHLFTLIAAPRKVYRRL